jgi:lipid II:glycine glycyltransferase (peptidoglycan interpeptide bridge formation enzyme)
MTIHFANQDQITSWNQRILANPDGGNLFQGKELADQKATSGWTPRFILANDLAITVLEKTVFGLGKLWYLPKGPGITSVRQLDELLLNLKSFANANGVFAVKIEPELRKSNETLADLMKLGLKRVRPIQPNSSTITLDISDNLDVVMTRLNQKGRHAIHRAERDGVTTKLVDTTDGNCRIMYNLLSETAAGSFSIRSYIYYKSFWQRYTKAGLGQLIFAYVDNAVVAGAFGIAFGEKGTYKDGASIRVAPDRMDEVKGSSYSRFLRRSTI